MSATVRNVLIVLALALAVFVIPGGNDTAAFIRALLSILITASIVFIGWRVYREHRVAIFSLGDEYRGVLYAALGALVLMMAASGRMFASAPGTLVWFAVVIAAAYALFAVYREYRSNAY